MPRRRKENHKDEYYYPVKIYLEDLEDIEQILNEEREKDSKIEIDVGDDYLYDSISEVKKYLEGKRIESLEIRAHLPISYVVIEFERWRTRLHISESNTTAFGLFHRIDEIISLRKLRRPAFLIPPPSLSALVVPELTGILLLFILLLIAHIIPSETISNILKSFAWKFAFVIFVGFVISLFTFLCMSQKTIFIKYKREEKSFFTRNRDILIALIFGSIFFIASYFFPR